jgi:hypothetical protein
MRQGRQGIHGVEIALHRAEIGLQAPEGGDDRGRHAVFGLCACEGVGVLLHLPRADLHAVGTDRAPGKLEEGLAENALGAVARQDLSVDRGIAERAGGHLFADAAGHRLGFHPFEKLGEIAAAGRRLRHGRCGGEACENKGRESFDVMMASTPDGAMNGPRIVAMMR